MIQKFLKNFLFLLIFYPVFLSLAQVVPYSGKLANNGINYNGSAGFTFTIMDNSGAIHWKNNPSNTPINISVSNGRYTALLGGQGMTPIPSDLFLAKPELYIKVMVDLKDGQGLRHLAPDQRISSTPHALSAEVARRLLPGSLTTEMISQQTTQTLRTPLPGSVYPDMLSQESLSKFNQPISRNQIIPGTITMDMLDVDLAKQVGSIGKPKSTWNRRFGGSGNDNLVEILETDFGWLLAGRTPSPLSGDIKKENKGMGLDFWVVAVNKSGFLLWENRFGGEKNDKLNGACQSKNGDFLLFGSTNSSVSGDVTEAGDENAIGDAWIIMIDNSGKKIWDKRFTDNYMHEISDAVAMEDNGFILSSVLFDLSLVRGGTELGVIRIDSTGNIIWTKQFGGNGYEGEPQFSTFIPNFKIHKIENEILIGGFSTSTVSGEVKSSPIINEVSTLFFNAHRHTKRFSWLIKIDLNGNIIWDKSFSSNSGESIVDITSTNDGNFILGSVTGISSTPIIRKIDSLGVIIWEKKLNSITFQGFNSISSTPDGGFLAVGSSTNIDENSSGTLFGLNDFWASKLDENGTIMWDKRYGGSVHEFSPTLSKSFKNGLIVGGDTFSEDGKVSSKGKGGTDFWILKIDENGNTEDTRPDIDEVIKPGGIGADSLNDTIVKHLKPEIVEFTHLLESLPEDGDEIRIPMPQVRGKYITQIWKKDGNTQMSHWVKDGSDYVIPNFNQSDHEGNWTLEVSNEFGSLESFSLYIHKFKGEKTIISEAGRKYKELEDFYNRRDGGRDVIRLLDANRSTLLFGNNHLNRKFHKNHPLLYDNTVGIMKLDQKFNFLFDKEILSNGAHFLSGCPTADGGFVLLGHNQNPSAFLPFSANSSRNAANSDDSDFLLAKFDSNGTLQWDKRYSGSSSVYNPYYTDGSIGWDLVQCEDGGFLLGGYSSDNLGNDKTAGSLGHADFWIVRTDENGSKLWDKRYGGSSWDGINFILKSNENGFLLCGETHSPLGGDLGQPYFNSSTNNGNDIWLVRVDDNGTLLWENRYGGSSPEYLESAILSPDNGAILVVSTGSNDGNVTDSGSGDWVLRVDENGTILWDKRFNNSDLYTACITHDENAFLLGGGGFLAKVDLNGTVIWQESFGSTGTFHSIHKAESGRYILSAKTNSQANDYKSENGIFRYFINTPYSDRYRMNATWVVRIDENGTITPN